MSKKRAIILQWAASCDLETGNVDSAIKQANALPSRNNWGLFLNQLLIWLGIISLASGAIFFFAYNWNDMSRFTKFALVEFAMLASVVSYLFLAKQKTIKTAILFAMALLTGALLALVGQTYQTGADPWQLFAVWCALIFPWVLLSRASSLWILWATLLNLSILLYLEMNRGIFSFLFREEDMFWIFGGVNTSMMLLLEILSLKDSVALKILKSISIANRLAAQVATIAAGFCVTWIAFIGIFDFSSYYALGLVVYVIWIAIAYRVYRFYYKDLLILSAGALSVIAVVIALLIKVLENSFGDGGFLVLTIAVIGLSSMAGIWLKKLSKEFSDCSEEQLQET